MLFKITRTKSCPQWIAPKYWSQMQQKFNSSTFQKISNAAKKNRSLAGPSHTGGSISFSEHEDRERRSKGDDFKYKELYKRLHKFKKGPKKGKFVSERSRKVLDDVMQIEDRYSSVDSSSTASSHLIPNEKEMFMEAAGGMKKGRVFGLGSEGAAITRGKTSMSVGSGETQMSEDIDKRVDERLQQQLKLIVPKLKIKMKKQMEAVYRQRDDAISSWMMMMSTQLGVSPPPIIHTDFDMVDVDDEDDDNDGAHDDGFTPPPDHHPSPGSGSNPPPPPPPSAAAPAQCAV